MAATNAFRAHRALALTSRFALEDLRNRWLDALLVCLPDPLRRLLASQEQRLIVEPQGGKARVFQSQGDVRVSLGELDSQVPGTLQAVGAGIKGTRRRTVIQLAASDVLKREVSFPAQVRDNLAQVIGYEIDRLSPFQSNDVYFDFRILEGSVRGDRLKVELAVCRRDRARDWLKRLRDGGLPVDQVTWDGAWSKANLLPAEDRPPRGAGLLTINKLLLLLVSILLAATLATPIWQMQRIRDARQAEIDDLKVQAEKVQEIRAALDRARQGSVAVLQRKWEQPRMIDLLVELTERLPDDTWIQNLDYSDGEIRIRGESAQATALINLLDQAPGITEVTFRSPVVQVVSTNRERFHISLRYKRPEEP